MKPGDRLTLTIDKPAAGGRMIARHEGAIVLVSGSIPGEVVEAEVEKIQRGTIWARTSRVHERSSDRIDAEGDWSCGGNVFAHIDYSRQLALKRQIVEDAFSRIARLPLPSTIDVAASPADGYRMRARLHVIDGRIGFFREGTHELCSPAGARQLLPDTVAILETLPALFEKRMSLVDEIELAENCSAAERALHLSLREEAEVSRFGSMPAVPGICGMSIGTGLGRRALAVSGTPEVTDELVVAGRTGRVEMTLTRQAHSFFQGNRFLLATLVGAVIDEVPEGSVLDLYAGVGLFSVALAARGESQVIAVEGERSAAHDLKRNAGRVGTRLQARHQSVEAFLANTRSSAFSTVIVDPPRIGMTREALAGTLALRPSRIVYLSCDVATLARDARIIVQQGYALGSARAFDLFPNTAHVESLVVFHRGES